MAFWLTLSVPPLLIALTSIAQQVFGQQGAQQILADQIAAQLPAQSSIIREIVQQEIPVLSLAGMGSLVFLLFSGSRVFGALIGAINAMWQHVEDAGLIRRQLLRLVMVLAVGGLLLASVLLQLGILGAREQIGLPADLLARYVLPFLLVVGGLWLTYALIPRRKATWGTALLGATAQGDIGDHFPPSDDRWKGADSAMMLAHVLDLVQNTGYRPVNMDATVFLEQPKLYPYKQAIRQNLSELLDLAMDAVSLKAKTAEGFAPVGTQEALAAAVRQALGDARVQLLFNTHYHADQSGGNALFGEAGADAAPPASPDEAVRAAN